MRFRRKHILTLSGALLSLSVSAQQPPLAQQGIDAFNEGDYQRALTLFQQAEAGGNTAESVDYNIAVSLYRLGRYQEAEQRFMVLAGQARWQVLVDYNLGLVNEAQGDIAQAREYYQRSAGQEEQEKIRQLATAKLNNLRQRDEINDTVNLETNAGKSWAALIKVTSGVDSNASSLADELLEQSDRGEDSFAQLLLYAHSYIIGSQRDGLRLYGLGFSKTFDEFSYLDSRVLGVGAVWEQPLFGWQSEYGLSFMNTALDSREVADQLQFKSEFWKRFQPGTFKFGLSWSDLSAGDDFRQVDGHRYRAELTWTKRFESVTTSLRFRQEWNNRRDLSRGGGFASYSPIRGSLRGKLDWRLGSSLGTHFEAEYIDSSYRDSNLLRDIDGSIRQARRQNQKLKLTAGISYRLGDSLRMELEYRHDDSADEFDLYTYDKDLLQASLQYQF